MAKMQAYDRMLRDPCGAPFAAPPYFGTDNGYFARTVDIIQPLITGTFTVGATALVDGAFQWVPAAYQGVTPHGYQIGFANVGSNFTMANSQPSLFMSTATVKKYRPVACCLKFTPAGQYASRAGVIGLAYTSGTLLSTSSAYNGAELLTTAQDVSPNGSRMHEVRWLPTNVDQNWSDYGVQELSGTGGGCVTIAFKGVDATGQTATTAYLNGYIEVTTIWEWVPTARGGLSSNPRPVPRFTIQDHQSSIKDIGEFLFGMAARGAYAVGQAFVTAGVRAARRRADPMLVQY
jgi:hypothetical protein